MKESDGLTKNKKIINATHTESFNINFKSKLEERLYAALLELGIQPAYEEITFTLITKFKPTVPFYNYSRRSRELTLDNKMLRSITYTPDFTFTFNNVFVIIEAKGFENDVFPVKRKLFRKYLEDYQKTINIPIMFFEVRTKRELLKAIKIVKNINTEKHENTV